jgi:hypothetical protein
MAISLKKAKTVFVGGISNSWSDFYLNMALEMAENIAKNKTLEGLANRGVFDFTGIDSEALKNLNENFWFAQSLAEEYDKVVRGGFTLFPAYGVPVGFGNKAAMQARLVSLLAYTKQNKDGDLLRDIGPAVQAYWVGAQLSTTATPKIPCIGALANINTVNGFNFNPGVWTPLSVPPMDNVSPWLLNFILSASVHLLTVTGLVTCACTYPPPAPPAPGYLPYQGYFIKPVSFNPIKSLDYKDMTQLAAGTLLAPVLNAFAEGTEANDTFNRIDMSPSAIAQQLTKGFIEGQDFQETDIRKALNSIINGDEPGMVEAGNTIRNNGG